MQVTSSNRLARARLVPHNSTNPTEAMKIASCSAQPMQTALWLRLPWTIVSAWLTTMHKWMMMGIFTVVQAVLFMKD